MDEVRVLPGILASGAEPDLPLLLVDEVNAADDVVSARDLVLDLPLLRIDEVEVPPAVALGGVEDLAGLVEPVHGLQVHVLGVCGPDERAGLLVDQVPGLAGVRVDLDHAEPLVAPVDLLVGEMAAVLVPVQSRLVVVDAVDRGLDLLPGGDVEEVQLVGVELVAGQVVGPRSEPGPAAPGGDDWIR